MLAQQVVSEFPGRVRFAVEDFGASPLAKRFGVDKYPAIFVDDALVARPEEFYGWGTDRRGRYMPWSETSKRRLFQADVRKMVEMRLRGEAVPSAAQGGKPAEALLPALTLTDLGGQRFALRGSGERPVLVELWATWCPPCLKTLGWLGEHPPAGVDVVALAVHSEKDAVAATAKQLRIPGRVAMATDDALAAFGGVPAVPMMVLADRQGKIVRTFYGAAPDLHEQISAELQKLR